MFVKSKTKNSFPASLLLLSTLFIFGLYVNTNAQKNSDSKILITIEREVCFGSCPAYTARVSDDGTVGYKGIDFVKVKGKKRYKIPKDKVQELVKAFEQINYFTLKDKYEADENGMSYTDLPTTTTSITVNGKYKKVVNYYGAPKELDELENKIDEILGLKKFIGK